MTISIVDRSRFVLIIGIVVASMVALVFLGIRLFNNGGQKKTQEAPAVYEALVQPFDQQSDISAEKDPSALEKGDVIAIFPEGHAWSETEKDSYLILKLKLRKNEAGNLLEPVTKEIEGDGAEKDKGLRKETIRARKYRLKIENLDFNLQKFWENPIQPYLDQVFDSSLIEEET